MENKEGDEELNLPDMEGVAYDMALESVVKIYADLRKAGLPRDDAAAIVAAIMIRGN